MIADTVAKPLTSVIQYLDKNMIKYKIINTSPIKRNPELLTENLYIIRQTTDNDGVYILVAAAKMGKEVSQSGI